MPTQIARTGGELTVEIPEELVAQAGFQVGEPLEWVLDGKGQMALQRPSDSPATKAHRRLTPEEILEGVPEGAVAGEYDWGPPQGVEVW